MRIERIWVSHEPDFNCDLSYLGEYSDSPGPNAIDRKARGDQIRNEYRYCNIALSAEQTGNPDSVEQDYQRMEAYQRGHWHMVGIVAKALVVVGNVRQEIRSGGLYGIESDSDKEHLDSIAREELAQLRDILSKLGFEDFSLFKTEEVRA